MKVTSDDVYGAEGSSTLTHTGWAGGVGPNAVIAKDFPWRGGWRVIPLRAYLLSSPPMDASVCTSAQLTAKIKIMRNAIRPQARTAFRTIPDAATHHPFARYSTGGKRIKRLHYG
jgi:hypothetical protein